MGTVFKTSSLRNGPKENVIALRFLDGQRKDSDRVQCLDFLVLDQVAQLGDEDPLIVIDLASVSSVAWTVMPIETSA